MGDNAGPLGFRNAPATKLLVLAVSGCSIVSHYLGSRSIPSLPAFLHHPILGMMSSYWTLSNPGAIVSGTLFLSRARVIERQFGSARYTAFVTICIVTSLLLSGTYQYFSVPNTNWRHFPGGPHALVVAMLLQYEELIPVHTASLFQRVIDVVGLLTLLSSSPRPVLQFTSGVITWALYSTDTAHLKHWRFPKQLRRLASRFLKPSNDNSAQQKPSVRSPSLQREPAQASSSSSVRRRRREVATEEHVNAVASMFPHLSREAINDTLVAAQHDPNRAAEILLSQGAQS